jgi:hypothetical protein
VTFHTYRLIMLHGNEEWDAWGDRWWAHVDAITDLRWVDADRLAELRRGRSSHSLDWGAALVEISREEVLSIIPTPEHDSRNSDKYKQADLVRGLPAGRFGIASIDECEPKGRPGERFEEPPDAWVSFTPDHD